MPVELQVIRASEFVCLDADERLDFEASKETLRALAQACRIRGLDCAMLDLRALPIPAKPHFTTMELAALVGTFREAGFAHPQRLAILYQYDVHGGVRNFAFISRLRGLKVRAFTDFEAAFHWLSGDSARRTERRENEVAIPITKRQSDARKPPDGITAGSPGAMASRPIKRTSSRQL